mmetsp:Transcript_44973/g.95914  ORF Transcript_44973/g.95914 Transcript_44973/m.95914 type:complete len:239 (+) Transcript_44973:543-1259(+)
MVEVLLQDHVGKFFLCRAQGALQGNVRVRDWNRLPLAAPRAIAGTAHVSCIPGTPPLTVHAHCCARDVALIVVHKARNAGRAGLPTTDATIGHLTLPVVVVLPLARGPLLANAGPLPLRAAFALLVKLGSRWRALGPWLVLDELLLRWQHLFLAFHVLASFAPAPSTLIHGVTGAPPIRGDAVCNRGAPFDGDPLEEKLLDALCRPQPAPYALYLFGGQLLLLLWGEVELHVLDLEVR